MNLPEKIEDELRSLLDLQEIKDCMQGSRYY
jgi:hypothetical protein